MTESTPEVQSGDAMEYDELELAKDDEGSGARHCGVRCINIS